MIRSLWFERVRKKLFLICHTHTHTQRSTTPYCCGVVIPHWRILYIHRHTHTHTETHTLLLRWSYHMEGSLKYCFHRKSVFSLGFCCLAMGEASRRIGDNGIHICICLCVWADTHMAAAAAAEVCS